LGRPSGTEHTATGDVVTLATAKLIVEFNATDNDIGVHGAFDDHGWSDLCVYAPDGTLVLAVRPQGQLQNLTMAGIFFENRPARNSHSRTSRRLSRRGSIRFWELPMMAPG